LLSQSSASRLRRCARPRAACCCCCPAHSSSRWATCAACYCCSLARQHGQAPASAVPELGTCASLGRAWRPIGGAAIPGESPGPLGAQQPSPVLERAAFNVASHHTYTILGSVLLVLLDAVVVLPLLHATLRPRQRVQTAAPAAPRVDTPLVPTPKMQHAQSAREGVSYNTV
jgi:hypothetical protein